RCGRAAGPRAGQAGPLWRRRERRMTRDLLQDILPAPAYLPFTRAFDAAAPTYNADYTTGNAIMHAFRVRSLRVLHRVLPREGGLLELGCGPGVEATMLAGAAQGR